MARSTKFYGDWADHHGKTVLIDGIKHRIETMVYMASYPRAEEMIDVQAVPVNKRTKYYTDIKDHLGDDWSTDLLDCDPELQAAVLQQLGAGGEAFDTLVRGMGVGR